MSRAIPIISVYNDDLKADLFECNCVVAIVIHTIVGAIVVIVQSEKEAFHTFWKKYVTRTIRNMCGRNCGNCNNSSSSKGRL